MKMNRQNPGGEIVTRHTMKGSEKYQARGKGDMTNAGYQETPSPMKKTSMGGDGHLQGKSRGGHVRSTAHAHTSMQGTIGPVGTGKGLK